MSRLTEPLRRQLATRTGRQEQINGILFALPWLLGLSILILYPIGASIYYSFTEYSVLRPPRWVGLANYIKMFTADDVFWLALYNTVYFAVFSVPLGIIVGVGIALMLNMKIKGLPVYRTIYFLPVLVPEVALSILWLWVLNSQFGILNAILWEVFGIVGPGWLADEHWSKPSVILMALWGVGQAVVIYLAGLQDVPKELYDAAAIDGANAVKRIRHVTIPMITPVIFFNLIMGLIGAFQYFTIPYVLTGGDGKPAQSLMFYSMYLYRRAFVMLEMGYASALAWLLFIIVLVCTLLVFRSSNRWVYYAGR